MSPKPLHQILLNLRENKNLKQKDVAKALGITQQTYSNYECGKRELPVHHLKNLAIFYNISIDYMLGLSLPNPDKPEPDDEYFKGKTISQLVYELWEFDDRERSELIRMLDFIRG